jgi:hypothetical protein
MKTKPNWEETKERFIAWWNHSSLGRPLLKIVGRRDKPLDGATDEPLPKDDQERFIGVQYKIAKARNRSLTHRYMAESIPLIDMAMGPGSLAAYLGSEPHFTPETVWFSQCIHDYASFGKLRFNEDNPWWKLHQEALREAHRLADGDYIVAIPDLIENIDILASLRGAQTLCMELLSDTDTVRGYLNQIDDLYFKYYDRCYNIAKMADGSSSFHEAFRIWGPGKIAKIQCDFSVMISPDQFRELVLPMLRRQSRELDLTLYHLDGPEQIRHLDALMEIEELDAVQWMPGYGKPPSDDECWFPIYDKVKAAGKSLMVDIQGEGLGAWLAAGDKIVKHFGPDGLYMLFYDMPERDGETVIRHAEKHWGK